MAKVFKSNLPKVISAANKEISTLLESDIDSESKILKGLVDQVLKANIEVKKKNNLRITQTKRRINELNQEISKLNVSIEDVDRDTVIKQLNEMIDAENKIFNARQAIRFFDIDTSDEKLEKINTLYVELIAKIREMYQFETKYQGKLEKVNNELFARHYEITKEITAKMNEIFNVREQYVSKKTLEFRDVERQLLTLEETFNKAVEKQISDYYAFNNTSSSVFHREFNKEDVEIELEKAYEKKTKDLRNEISSLRKEFALELEALNEENEAVRKEIEEEVYGNEDIPVQKVLSKEEKLQEVRQEIMLAEKANDIARVTKLLKQFDKIEKQGLSAAKPTDEKGQEFYKRYSKIEKEYNKTIQLKKAEHNKQINMLEYEIAEAKINFEEEKILHKIKFDRDALSEYTKLSTDQIDLLRTSLSNKLNSIKEIYKIKLDLRISELEMMKENELLESDISTVFRQLLSGIKLLEHNRLSTIVEDINAYDLLRVNQKELIQKDIALFKLQKQLDEIDQQIVEETQESIIQNELKKEDANSEIIYQESLLEIAKKEHELQTVKAKSLYENEKTLAEDQINRISMGIKVNDAFVKTTLNNQLLFANQQMKLAESEYEIRIESINLTRNQELDYASKKIELYKHNYEYEIGKLEKERDDKLEDLKYKLLLFKGKEQNQKIQQDIDALNEEYEKKIEVFRTKSREDQEIKRYKRVIDEANKRAEEAIKEATIVRDQTVSSFEKLRDTTLEQFDSLLMSSEDNDNSRLLPVLNNDVIGSAEERMQKALREANILYDERVIEPQRIIKENKEILANIETNQELKDLIDNLEARKITLQEEYEKQVQLISEQREQDLIPYDNLLIKARAIKEMEVKYIDESMYDNLQYRDQEMIIQDYDNLIEAEKAFYEEKITAFETRINDQLKGFTQIYNGMMSEVKQALSKYDSFIKFASRDLVKQKKELKAAFKSDLKQTMKSTD